MAKSCKNCVHYSICGVHKLCGNYYPLYDIIDEKTMDEIIESNRKEFHKEWNEYIEKFND